MNNQLGWTSLDQAKQLIKAGLDTNTADMSYLYDWNNSKNFDVPDTIVTCDWDDDYNKNIPCWTLGALIGLLPKTIETKKPKNLYFPEILPSNNCVAYTALNGRKEMVFLKMFATGVESDATLIDNMVSMICWLLENNYIKKGNVK